MSQASKKRVGAWLLSLALLPGLLAGCGGKANDSDQTDRVGMFVQTTMNPIPGGEIYGQVGSTSDGGIMLYGLDNQQLPKAFVSKDLESWTEIDSSAAQDKAKELRAQGYTLTPVMSEDEAWWLAASFPGNEDLSTLLYLIRDGETSEINFGLATDVLKIDRILPLPQGGAAVMLSEGIGVENAIAQWFVFDADGQKICDFAVNLTTEYSYGAIIRDGSLYIPERGNGRLAEYSLQTGERIATRPIPSLAFGTENIIFDIAENGDFCYVNRTGIHRQAEGSGLEQDMVTGTQFIFADGGYVGTSFLTLQDGSYLLYAHSNSGDGLYHISFDENASLGNITELTIWALEETHLLRTGVAFYSQAHPDVHVEIEYGRSLDEDGRTNDDVLRALNTRIVAGDVPDILVMDGLPFDTYINQGLLLDLNGKIDVSNCYESIMNAYQRGNSTYAYPTLYKMPVLVCPANDPLAGKVMTLEHLANLASTPDNIYYGDYLEMFEVLYTAYSDQIFPGAADIDEAALEEFLVNTKRIADAIGLTEDIEYMYGGMSNEGIYPRQGISKYFEGGTEYAADILWETVQIVMLFMSGDKEFVPLPGGSFLPVCSMAVTAGTENADLAFDFIQTMLTEPDIQGLRMEQGFSVVKGMHLPYYEKRSEDLEGSPEKYDWDQLVESFTTPAITEVVLQDKLYDQAVLYYKGDISLEQAIEAVLNNTRLYFEERK